MAIHSARARNIFDHVLDICFSVANLLGDSAQADESQPQMNELSDFTIL